MSSVPPFRHFPQLPSAVSGRLFIRRKLPLIRPFFRPFPGRVSRFAQPHADCGNQIGIPRIFCDRYLSHCAPGRPMQNT
jgi:hypothetical protein